MRRKTCHGLRRGSALIVALIFVASISTLAVAFATVCSSSIQVTRNERGVHRAQAAAESGLEYVKNILSLPLEGKVPNAANIADIRSKLRTFCTLVPLRDDNGNAIADLETGPMRIGGNTFSVQLAARISNAAYRLHASVTGYDDSTPNSVITREVSCDFFAKVDYPYYFDDGIFSKGTIVYHGTPKIRSKKAADGSSLYTYIDPITGAAVDGASLRSGSDAAISIMQKGNSVPDGGFYVTGWTGSQVDGYTGNKITKNYVPPSMPIFDPTAFKDLAPTAYAPNASNTYTNVRIPANTNPSLSGTFRGILYIEAPNNVSFSDVTLNCAVVAADKDNAGNVMTAGSNTLNFSTNIAGGRIPDDLKAIRDAVAGYGIFAPTMNISINGRGSQSMYGSIICNALSWEGGSDIDVIDGAMIVLSSSPDAVAMGGNASMTFSKDANFVKPSNGLYDDSYLSSGYRSVANSYSEGL